MFKFKLRQKCPLALGKMDVNPTLYKGFHRDPCPDPTNALLWVKPDWSDRVSWTGQDMPRNKQKKWWKYSDILLQTLSKQWGIGGSWTPWCCPVKYWPVSWKKLNQTINTQCPLILQNLTTHKWWTTSACFKHIPGGFMWSPCGRGWVANNSFLIFSITILTSYPLIFFFFLDQESYSDYPLYRH